MVVASLHLPQPSCLYHECGPSGTPGQESEITCPVAPDAGLWILPAQGDPDIFPANHAVEHGTVVFRTAGGTKHSAALGTMVAFETDGYDTAAGEAWSVVMKGVAREVSEIDDAIALMGMPLLPWHSSNKPHFLRIVPETVTGRRFPVAPSSVSPGSPR